MYCEKCGSELVWRKERDDGFNIKTGNRQIIQVRTCPLAETLPWYTRILTCHGKQPLIYGYGDCAWKDTRTIDINKKETA